MLKQNTNPELTYPALVPVAVVVEGSFIVLAPIRVVHIRTEGNSTLCAFNDDGKFQRIHYTNSAELAADFEGLRAIMRDTARHTGNTYWEAVRENDDKLLLNIKPRDVTDFHTYAHPITQETPCTHHATIGTDRCTLGLNLTASEVTFLSDAILDAHFGKAAL